MSNILNKDTRMMSGASIVDFEHILLFVLLLIWLNSNKYMPVGPEEWWFQTFSKFEKHIVLQAGKIC